MPDHDNGQYPQPFLNLLPNLLTILGLCAGLTAIRYALSDRFEIAAGLILFAALIDGLDGQLARRLNATSDFGAELDSLSDFLNFGVAPGLLVYELALGQMQGPGWIFVLVYAVCCCLRLARFNVNRDRPDSDEGGHFTGVPAPAGAMLAMLPVFLTLQGVVNAADIPIIVAPYLGLVGALMISRIPTFSPKSLRLSRDQAGWALIGTAILVGLLLARIWLLMVLADAVYLFSVLRALLPALMRTRK